MPILGRIFFGISAQEFCNSDSNFRVNCILFLKQFVGIQWSVEVIFFPLRPLNSQKTIVTKILRQVLLGLIAVPAFLLIFFFEEKVIELLLSLEYYSSSIFFFEIFSKGSQGHKRKPSCCLFNQSF